MKILISNQNLIDVKWIESLDSGKRILRGRLNNFISISAESDFDQGYELIRIKMKLNGYKINSIGKLFELPITSVFRIDSSLVDLQECIILFTKDELNKINDSIENLLSIIGKDYINFTNIR